MENKISVGGDQIRIYLIFTTVLYYILLYTRRDLG